jgi:hypothetical protein
MRMRIGPETLAPILGAAIVILALALLSGPPGEPGEPGPEVLVVRQEYVPDALRGGHVLLVEYYVGGMAMSATFREGEDALYREWLAHLESVGRVRVVAP